MGTEECNSIMICP